MAKFNFKKVSGKKNYKGWKEWEIGDFVAGKYVGEVPGYKGSTENPNHVVEIYETSFEGVKEGEEFVLNHNGLLKYHLQNRAIKGDIIKVEYLGKEPMKDDPDTLAHQVEVYIAQEEDMKVKSADLPEEDADEEDYGL